MAELHEAKAQLVRLNAAAVDLLPKLERFAQGRLEYRFVEMAAVEFLDGPAKHFVIADWKTKVAKYQSTRSEYLEELLYGEHHGQIRGLSRLVGVLHNLARLIASRSSPIAKRTDVRAVISLLGEYLASAGVVIDEGTETATRQPYWDTESRTLHFGNEAIIQFTSQKAPNLIAILDAFEADGWPARIADPIPPSSMYKGFRNKRLQDACAGLNRKQNDLIFEMDGTGMGVTWRPAS